MNREWRVIKGFENYSISNDGIVWNNKRNTLKAQRTGSKGYNITTIYNNAKPTTIAIHRLVADAFVSNSDPINKTDVNHKDGNKLNNSFENLEWVSKSENMLHAYSTGLNPRHASYGMLGKKNPNGGVKGIPIRIMETGEIFNSLIECAKAINGKQKGISDALNGRIKTHRGYHFEKV